MANIEFSFKIEGDKGEVRISVRGEIAKKAQMTDIKDLMDAMGTVASLITVSVDSKIPDEYSV